MITVAAKPINEKREQIHINYLDGITGKLESVIAFKPAGTAKAWARDYGWRLEYRS